MLETRRLALDPFDAGRDAAFLLELLNERAFVANIRDSGVRTPDDARRYAEDGPIASAARFGFALWKVSLVASGEAVGMCGLVKRDALPDPDLGFAYLERHHRRGYGLEAASAVLGHARGALSLRRVLGIVAPHNEPSARLLLRLGFREEGAAPTAHAARLFVHDG